MDSYGLASDGWEDVGEVGILTLLGALQVRFDEDGTGTFRFQTNKDHANRAGFIHGGLLLALGDSALGYTARRANPQRRHATMHFDMTFISAAPAGSVLELRCSAVAKRRTVDFMQADILADGKLVARATGMWKVFDPAQKAGS